MQDKPKFIFNQGTRKFEGLDPEDDIKIEDLKKAKAASEINKFVKSTLPPEDKPADVYETNAALNKFRLPHDQLKPVYNKDIGTFVRGNKKGPLKDFKLRETGAELSREYQEEQKKIKRAYERSVVDYNKQPFQSSLNKLKRQPKKRSEFAAIYDVSTPQEKAQMRKDFPEFNFRLDKHKSEIREEQMLKQKITPLAPNPYLEERIQEIENKPPVKVEPDFDVEQFVKEKARESLRKEREDHIRKYGDQGLSQLHLINKGLFE